jgi:hypothetical protein
MSLQVKLAISGNLAGFAEQTHLRIARGARIAAEKQAARAKLALRSDMRAAGLGDRLANTWRVNVFPKSASSRTHSPAVFVKSGAPEIVTAFDKDTTIRSRQGLWLAIPTDSTPRKGRRLATPLEVEAMFNQDLIFLPGRGGQMLAFVNAIKARTGGKFRRATKRRTKDGRQNELVLMFVMVRQVTLRKRLNWSRIFDDLAKGWAQLFPAEIAAALNAGSN